MLLSVTENTYKNIFSSLVNVLNYDLITFFTEKDQVSPP